jgi:3-isopropylmalate dehydrogenase
MESHAVLLGAVGGPKWSDPNSKIRPEQGLLKIRAELGVFANLRPVRVIDELSAASPLKAELLQGVDMIVVRELTGGIYFGEKFRDENSASDLCTYQRFEVERIVRVAARLASERSGRICSVDKANVLETSRLWRDVASRTIAQEFPKLQLEHMLVDAAAMHLLARPREFDVIVTARTPKRSSTSAASAAQLSSLRLAMTTFAPWDANASTISRPSPRLPPVTTAVRPERSKRSDGDDMAGA